MGESERLYEKRYEINFSWSVPSEGFQWDNPFPLGSDQYLVEKQNSESKTWNPFTRPDSSNGSHSSNNLFANFAEMEASDANFLRWASLHGRLTCGHYIYDPQVGGDEILMTSPELMWENPVESRSLWYQKHNELRDTFDIWKFADAGDKTELKNHFGWEVEDGKPQRYGYYPEGGDKASQKWASFKHCPPGIGETGMRILFSPKDDHWPEITQHYSYLADPAKLYVQRKIELEIRKSMCPPRKESVRDVKKKTILNPPDLLSAMWVQFYFYANGELGLKRCSVCQEWEDMSYHDKDWTQHEKKCGVRIRQRRRREQWKKPSNDEDEE